MSPDASPAGPPSESDSGRGTPAELPSPATPVEPVVGRVSVFAAFQTGALPLYLVGNLCVILGTQVHSTTVGWELYRRTGDALNLGLVGLAQFGPILAFSLIGGRASDVFNRRVVLMASLAGQALASSGLAWSSLRNSPIWEFYLWLAMSGMARAFVQPSKASFLPLIVPAAVFPNAVAWNMGVFQLASVAGPVLAGWLISRSPHVGWVYLTDAALIAVFFVCLIFVRLHSVQKKMEPEPLGAAIQAGWRFVTTHKVILAAITLDMLAVLLGGATALFPIYAEDILHVGSEGLGTMRGAMAVGALAMSLALTSRSPMGNAGRNLLWSVAGFGLATIVFGVSHSYVLSLAMLFLMGALDMVSVVIRHTLVQTLTPDEMRGRVSAINGIFINASNELGAFRSGLTTKLLSRAQNPVFGPMVAVVLGGLGTVAMVLLVARKWPELRDWKPAVASQK